MGAVKKPEFKPFKKLLIFSLSPTHLLRTVAPGLNQKRRHEKTIIIIFFLWSFGQHHMDNRSSYFPPIRGARNYHPVSLSLHFTFVNHICTFVLVVVNIQTNWSIFSISVFFLPSKRKRKKESKTNCMNIIIRRRKKAAILLVSSRLNFFNNDISNLFFFFQATNNVRSHFRSVSFFQQQKKSKSKKKTEMKKSFLLIRPHCICFGTWELRGWITVKNHSGRDRGMAFIDPISFPPTRRWTALKGRIYFF